MKKILKFCRDNWHTFLTMLIASTMGFYFAAILPIPQKSVEVVYDTLYIQQPLPDTLFQRISLDVSEINEKLTPKKVYVRKRPAISDTIRIDASLKLENK